MSNIKDQAQRRRAGAPILVVDDEPGIVATVREFLELEGYEVMTASNGAAAIEMVLQSRPQLILLDMRMPVLDGWGFAREMRRRQIHVPIVVMTAAHSARAWAAEIHADGVLPKPFDLDDLLVAVERYSQPPPESTE